MKCSLCGFEFNEKDARTCCGGCGLIKKCELLKCPNCGFEAAPDPKWAKKFKETVSKPNKPVMPLTDLSKNKDASVVYIRTHDKNALQKMIAMGILPNTKIKVLQKFPSYVLQMGKSQFVVDKELAWQIYVVAA